MISEIEKLEGHRLRKEFTIYKKRVGLENFRNSIFKKNLNLDA